MRALVVVASIAFASALAPASQASVFADLPGSGVLERATAGQAPDVASSSKDAPQPQGGRQPEPNAGVPAPDPSTITKVEPEQLQIVTALPGGRGLPIIKDVAQASGDARSIAPLVLLALAGVVLFTRFLFRLNELGRRPV